MMNKPKELSEVLWGRLMNRLRELVDKADATNEAWLNMTGQMTDEEVCKLENVADEADHQLEAFVVSRAKGIAKRLIFLTEENQKLREEADCLRASASSCEDTLVKAELHNADLREENALLADREAGETPGGDQIGGGR